MLNEEFDALVDAWVLELKQYTPYQITFQPAVGTWSLGQLCSHIQEATQFFLDQVLVCGANEGICNEMTSEGKAIFRNNKLPDMDIEGPPENQTVVSFTCYEEIESSFLALKHQFRNSYTYFLTQAPQGKTRHPGLGCFGAEDWLRFAVIHFRHHDERQYLKIKKFVQFDAWNQ